MPHGKGRRKIFKTKPILQQAKDRFAKNQDNGPKPQGKEFEKIYPQGTNPI
jgi:hypothetical protein